jgi:hypothetical protein
MTLEEFKMVVDEFPELSFEKDKSYWYAFVREKGCGDIRRNNLAIYSFTTSLTEIKPAVQLVYINDIKNKYKDLYIEIRGSMYTDGVNVLRNHFKESLFLIKKYHLIVKEFNLFKKQQELEKDFEHEAQK